MEKKNKIIIVVLVVIVAVLASLIAYHMLTPQERPDEVVKLNHISFNITNKTNDTSNFKIVEKGTGWMRYFDNSSYARNLAIHDINKMDNHDAASVLLSYNNKKMTEPSQTVNGYVVYTTSATNGGVGTPMYESFIVNTDNNVTLRFVSNDINETVKMVSTVKFDK